MPLEHFRFFAGANVPQANRAFGISNGLAIRISDDRALIRCRRERIPICADGHRRKRKSSEFHPSDDLSSGKSRPAAVILGSTRVEIADEVVGSPRDDDGQCAVRRHDDLMELRSTRASFRSLVRFRKDCLLFARISECRQESIVRRRRSDRGPSALRIANSRACPGFVGRTAIEWAARRRLSSSAAAFLNSSAFRSPKPSLCWPRRVRVQHRSDAMPPGSPRCVRDSRLLEHDAPPPTLETSPCRCRIAPAR